VSLTCGSAVANSQRRLTLTGGGPSTTIITGDDFEFVGGGTWIKYWNPYGMEYRIFYDTSSSRWRVPSYSVFDDDVLVGEWQQPLPRSVQGASPIEWDGLSVFPGEAALGVRYTCPRGMWSPAMGQCAACPDYMDTDFSGATSASACRCRPGYVVGSGNGNGGDGCQPCPANTWSDGTSCVACAEDQISPPASPLRSYCYKTAKVCRRLYITGLSTEWYPNGVLDGFYEWDGFATLRYQPFYRFAGGRDICLSANTNLAWAWQPCSDREAVRMGDLGEVLSTTPTTGPTR